MTKTMNASAKSVDTAERPDGSIKLLADTDLHLPVVMSIAVGSIEIGSIGPLVAPGKGASEKERRLYEQSLLATREAAQALIGEKEVTMDRPCKAITLFAMMIKKLEARIGREAIEDIYRKA